MCDVNLCYCFCQRSTHSVYHCLLTYSYMETTFVVDRLGSRCNHSCRPNMTWSFKQKTHLVLRTLRDVAPGEQLTIAYLDVVAPASQRAAALRQQYAFSCQCPRCNRDTHDPTDWWLSGCLVNGALRTPTLPPQPVVLVR